MQVEDINSTCSIMFAAIWLPLKSLLAYTFNPRTWAMETRGSRAHGHSQPCGEFKTSLRPMRPYFKTIVLSKMRKGD